MDRDSRSFFLLVESIIEIRWNPIFLKHSYWGKIIPASEQLIFWIVEIILLHFLEIPTSDFLCLVEKHFSTKSFIPASWNEFSG